MWECEWDAYLESHPADKDCIRSIGLSSPLDIHDALLLLTRCRIIVNLRI